VSGAVLVRISCASSVQVDRRNSSTLKFRELQSARGVMPLSARQRIALNLPALLLQLSHSRQRDRNLIRGEGIKQDAVDKGIHRQSSDLLARRASTLIAIRAEG
jgi:hypothetical protein